MAMIRPETEMKDSGVKYVGLIPKTWKIIQLKYCTDCLDGKRVPIDASLRKSGIYPYWGAGRIMDYVDDYIFDERLVLLGEDGAPFFDDFRPVSHLIDGKVWVNNHIHVLRTKDNIVDSYLVHSLNSVDYHEYINGSILNKLTQSNMNRIKIPLPSIAEQQVIADYLDKTCSQIDDIIAEAKASIDEYKELRQGVIFEAVTKGLDKNVEMKDSGIEWIGETNKNTVIKKIKYTSNISRGLFNYRPRNAEFLYGGIHPFIQTGDVARANKYVTDYKQTLSDEGTKISKFFPKGTLTMTIAANVGDVSILGFDAYFPDSVLGITPFDKYSSEYLYYVFSAMKSEFVRVSISNAQLNLNIERVKELFVPIFEDSYSQKKIVDYLDEKCKQIDSLITEKESLINDLEAYKKSLIYEVVTGKRRVV